MTKNHPTNLYANSVPRLLEKVLVKGVYVVNAWFGQGSHSEQQEGRLRQKAAAAR